LVLAQKKMSIASPLCQGPFQKKIINAVNSTSGVSDFFNFF